MADPLPFFLVDAFAEEPYRGNVAGVVLEADRLNDRQMQLVAQEINASETAFLTRIHDLHRPPRLRWFTPATEVDFCGHATLAAAHALWDAGHLGDVLPPAARAPILDTVAGELRVQPESLPPPYAAPLWWLEMPDAELSADHSNPAKLCELLGCHEDDLEAGIPRMRTRDHDVILFVRDWQTLTDLRPRFDDLAAWCARVKIRGVCVATTATLSPAVNVHSRFFAPACGVNEDPVTGSVHGPLATLLVVSELVGVAQGQAAVVCAQGIPGGRSGIVRALVEATPGGYRVKVGGLCHTTLRGTVAVPPAR